MPAVKKSDEPASLPVDNAEGRGYKDGHPGGLLPVLSGSFPVRRYRVKNIANTPPNYYEMVREGLKAGVYRESASAIWSGVRTGWCSIDNYLNEDPSDQCMVGEYAVFGLRIDTKNAPAALVRAKLSKMMEAWKQEHGAKAVPKDVKQELRENVTNEVLSNTSPRTKVIDVAWDTVNDWIVLSNLSESVAENFTRQFHSSFPGLTLELWQPFGSDEDLLSDLEQRAANFYLWLWWSIDHGEELYGVESISVDGKVVLSGSTGETAVSSEDINKVVEVRPALRSGKRPSSMKLRFECNGREYAFTLNGSRMFIPTLKLPDSGENKKSRLDREAAILDRMGAYAALHDTMAEWVRDFLTLNANEDRWTDVSAEINDWME
jgi:hypothetical protein